MKILGIETSCDETAAAVVENGKKILTNVVTSSLSLHQKEGGIIPEKAAREQIKYIIPVIQKALIYKKKLINPDAIAVTSGPGLIGSLLIGVETAKTLSFCWKKPIIPVNHLLAHIYSNFLKPKAKISFPAICLIVSGGHTQLVLMKNHQLFKNLGGTRDDAAGECFDKCARLLNLGYPGGPVIEKAAKKINLQKLPLSSLFKIPRPMIKENNFDFSFSGLKTAIINLLNKNQNLPPAKINLLAFQIQEAITEVLISKTLKAAQEYQVKSIMIGGGVAANEFLRKKFRLIIVNHKLPFKLFIPPKNLCTDNAAGVASFAFFNFKPIPWQKIKANPSWEIS